MEWFLEMMREHALNPKAALVDKGGKGGKADGKKGKGKGTRGSSPVGQAKTGWPPALNPNRMASGKKARAHVMAPANHAENTKGSICSLGKACTDESCLSKKFHFNDEDTKIALDFGTAARKSTDAVACDPKTPRQNNKKAGDAK